jgi:putative transposase
MSGEKSEPRRRSPRLRGYDYSQPGAYFVTICVRGQKHLLGVVEGGDVLLSPVGQIIDQCWRNITNRNSKIEIDVFIVMPNHLHGIIKIHDVGRGEAIDGKS